MRVMLQAQLINIARFRKLITVILKTASLTFNPVTLSAGIGKFNMYLDSIGKLMDGAIKAMRFFKTEFQIDIKNEEFYLISPLSYRVIRSAKTN